ncbi:histone deacetylase 2, putative [Plasmodium gallinaceum]|uniref:histone deacetylase n=1 Tax=Plasmodium gallinaceum TaxID=5849 RepID=A0A1J1GNS5_PLAGA|nr:histone deacetylase 2, putative [Plasmodium gallinaceum]CRG94137.1 histone deacetylase 2, putative [Plasmodium gallinaceum]
MKNKILNEKSTNENKKILIKQGNFFNIKSHKKNLIYNNLIYEKFNDIKDINENIKEYYITKKKNKENDSKNTTFDLKNLDDQERFINYLDSLKIENIKSENISSNKNYKKKKKKIFDYINEDEINYIDINNTNSDNLYIHEKINKEYNKRLKHRCKNNNMKEYLNSTKKHCSKIWNDDECNYNKDDIEKLIISINKYTQIETKNNNNLCKNYLENNDIRYEECQNEHNYKIYEKKSNCNNESRNNNTKYKKYKNDNEINFSKSLINDRNNYFKLENNNKNNFLNIMNNNINYDCVGFVCDEEYMCENFHFDEDHVESPDRIKCIIKKLKEKNVINKMIQIKCREALFDEIKQCHSSRHINNIFYSLKKKLKYKKKKVIYPFDKHDTYYTSHTGIVSKRAVGGLLNLCDAILSDKNEKFKYIDFKKSILYNYNFFNITSENNINKYEKNKINYLMKLKRSESDSNIYIKEKSKNNIFDERYKYNIYKNQDLFIESYNISDNCYNNEVINNDNNNCHKEDYINEKSEDKLISHILNNIYNMSNYKIYKKKYRSYSTSVFNMNDCNNNNFFTNINCGFAAIRPPGHHCSKNNSSGFCIFNNISVACKYISKKYGIKKIFIFDWDVHHNNGTQEIFYSDKDVLCFSIHRFDKKKEKIKKKTNITKNTSGNSSGKNMKSSNKKRKKSSKLNEENLFFPCSGAKNELGDKNGYMFNINVPLEKGYNNCDVYYVFKYLLLPVLKKFQPEFIFISCGFDASINDPLGECNLTHNLYHWMTLQLKNFANIFCNGRIILVLEGGYNLKYLPKCALACIKALIKKNTNSKQEYSVKKTNDNKLISINSKEIIMDSQNNTSLKTDISSKLHSNFSTKNYKYNTELFLDKKTKKNVENTNVINLDNIFNCIDFNYNSNSNIQNNIYKLKNYTDFCKKSKELRNKDIHVKRESKMKKLITAGKLHYSTYKVIKYFSCILKGDPFRLNIKLPPYNYFIKKKDALYKEKLNNREIIIEDNVKMQNKIFDSNNIKEYIDLTNLKDETIELNNISQRCITYYSESSTTTSDIYDGDIYISDDETDYNSSFSSKNSRKKVIILNRLKLEIDKEINTSSSFPTINIKKKTKENKKLSNYNKIEKLNKNVELWDLTNLENDDHGNSSEINDLNNSSINCDLTNLKYNENQVMNSFKMYTKRKKGFIFFYGSGHRNQWVLPIHKKITKIIKLCSNSEAYFYAWLYLCCKKEICIGKTKENYSSILEGKEKIDNISISREFCDDERKLAKEFLKFTVPCYNVFLKENQINELNNKKNTETYSAADENLYDSIDVHIDKCIEEILKSIHPIKKSFSSYKKNCDINHAELININNLNKNCIEEDMNKKYMSKQYEIKTKKNFKQNMTSTLDEDIMNFHNISCEFLKSNCNSKRNLEKNTCITDNESKNVYQKRKSQKKEKVESNSMNNPKNFLKEKKTAICLSNVLSTMQHPCVIDVKMGIRLYGDNCNKESIQKKIEKAKNRSCLSHGFHLTSLIGWCKKKKGPFFISKEDAHSIKNDDDFVSAFTSYFMACDDICLSILLIKKILLILEKMKIFFENQNYFAFYGSSLLFVFDSDPSKNKCEYIYQKNFNQLNLLPIQDKVNKKETRNNELNKNKKIKQEKNCNNERKNYEEIYNFKGEIEKLFEESLTNEEKNIYMDNKLNAKILKSADVYIIDFAHASLNKNEKDEGFLLGIISLHRILKKTIEKIKNFHLNKSFNFVK